MCCFVAYLNLVLDEPAWLTRLHAGCAFAGMLAITRFIQGSPAALRGPSTRATVAQGFVVRNGVGVVNIVVPGQSAFFSSARCAMILCFVICLMVQFIRVGKPANGATHSPSGTRAHVWRTST